MFQSSGSGGSMALPVKGGSRRRAGGGLTTLCEAGSFDLKEHFPGFPLKFPLEEKKKPKFLRGILKFTKKLQIALEWDNSQVNNQSGIH